VTFVTSDAIDPAFVMLLFTQALKIPEVSFGGKPSNRRSFPLPIENWKKNNKSHKEHPISMAGAPI